MNKFLKNFIKFILKFFGIIAAIILLLMIILGIAVQFFDANNYKPIIEKTFKQQTGQSLLLNGPVKIEFLPFPRAKMNDAIMTLSYKGNKAQLFAKEFAFDLGWSFLFSDRIDIKAINGKFITIQFFGKEAKSQKFVIDSFSGRVKSTCCDIDIPSFTIQMGKDIVEGKINIALLSNIPKITGKLNATQWSLPLYSSNDTATAKPLSNQVFPVEWINDIEGQIDFHVDKLLLNDKPIQNVDVNFNLKNKTLMITPKTRIGGGEVNGKLIIKQNADSSIKMDVALNVVNSNANLFLKKFNNQKLNLQKFPIEEGMVDYSYTGSSNGKSIASLISNISGKSLINFKNIKITLFKNTFNGNLNLSSVANATSINGKLNAKRVEISSMGENWNFDWLKSTDGQIELYIDDLMINHIRASNANIVLKMKNNELTFSPQVMIAGGKMSGQVAIQPSNNSTIVKTALTIHNASAGEFLKFFAPKVALNNGNIEVNFEGRGQGKNLQSIISTLSGKILINIQELSIEETRIDSRYVDLFSALWKAFTPAQPGTLLQCAVLRFDIANGQAVSNQSIGMETSDLSILGGGDLNLATKEINFTFDMYPRSQMNIELGSFNNIVYLKGTLDQPQISASMQGVIKEGGTLALGVVTGGISLLVEKLVKIATQKKSVCQQVLSGGQ